MSVPCGFDNSGLPVGLEILGPVLSEEIMLRAAHAFEQATDFHKQKPAI